MVDWWNYCHMSAINATNNSWKSCVSIKSKIIKRLKRKKKKRKYDGKVIFLYVLFSNLFKLVTLDGNLTHKLKTRIIEGIYNIGYASRYR
jgi:rRNA-processing protein FCF1